LEKERNPKVATALIECILSTFFSVFSHNYSFKVRKEKNVFGKSENLEKETEREKETEKRQKDESISLFSLITRSPSLPRVCFCSLSLFSLVMLSLFMCCVVAVCYLFLLSVICYLLSVLCSLFSVLCSVLFSVLISFVFRVLCSVFCVLCSVFCVLSPSDPSPSSLTLLLSLTPSSSSPSSSSSFSSSSSLSPQISACYLPYNASSSAATSQGRRGKGGRGGREHIDFFAEVKMPSSLSIPQAHALIRFSSSSSSSVLCCHLIHRLRPGTDHNEPLDKRAERLDCLNSW